MNNEILSDQCQSSSLYQSRLCPIEVKTPCLYCNQQFESKRELRKHYDKVHMTMMFRFPTDEPCYTCDEILATKTDLREQ